MEFDIGKEAQNMQGAAPSEVVFDTQWQEVLEKLVEAARTMTTEELNACFKEGLGITR